MKPLKIKKSDNLKKELSKIKGGGNTDTVPPPDDENHGTSGQTGATGALGAPGANAGQHFENSLDQVNEEE